MTMRRFRVGQRVQLKRGYPFRMAADGFYEVIRQLPDNAGEFYYRDQELARSARARGQRKRAREGIRPDPSAFPPAISNHDRCRSIFERVRFLSWRSPPHPSSTPANRPSALWRYYKALRLLCRILFGAAQRLHWMDGRAECGVHLRTLAG